MTTNRLDQLKALRAALDTEIEREARYQQRIRRIRSTMRVATTRGDWTTRIIKSAAAHFDTSAEDVLSTARDQDAIRARHVAAWLLRESGRSYPEIGRLLGGRDHTTGMNSVRRVEASPVLLSVAVSIRDALWGEGLTA